MDSNISSRMRQIPYFYFLTLILIFKVNTFDTLIFVRIWWEIEKTSLLPSDRKSGIDHRIAPLRRLYILTLTYIAVNLDLDLYFTVTKFMKIIYYLIFWKRWNLAKKSSSSSFIEVNIGHIWCNCKCCTSWPWRMFSWSHSFLKSYNI